MQNRNTISCVENLLLARYVYSKQNNDVTFCYIVHTLQLMLILTALKSLPPSPMGLTSVLYSSLNADCKKCRPDGCTLWLPLHNGNQPYSHSGYFEIWKLLWAEVPMCSSSSSEKLRLVFVGHAYSFVFLLWFISVVHDAGIKLLCHNLWFMMTLHW